MHARMAAAGQALSLNWAGYVAESTTPSLNSGVGSWIVPTLQCPTRGHYDSSTWVGQGGVVANDVLYQTGTAAACDDGVVSYRAWWEQVPNLVEQDFPDAVVAGDHFQGSVGFPAAGTIQLTLVDFGKAWPKTATSYEWREVKTIANAQPGYSIECVVERPSFEDGSFELLAPFKPTGFKYFARTPWNLPGCQTTDPTSGTPILIAKKGQTVPAGITIIPVSMVNEGGLFLVRTSAPSRTGAIRVVWHGPA